MPSFQKAHTSFMCVKHKTGKTLAPQSNYTSHQAYQYERWIITRKVSMMSHADKYSIKTKQGKKLGSSFQKITQGSIVSAHLKMKQMEPGG